MPLARKIEAQDPRSLQARIDAAMGVPKRRRRGWPYVAGAVLSLAAIWALVAAYVVMTPPSYTSRFTLILPGSGSQISVSLDSIGQASSAPTPQFSGPSLSPKVIYKEIAQSDQVRAMAASSLGLAPQAFPRPRVRLVEETSLLMFEVRAATPADARIRAEALNAALARQLDILRRDELERRAAAVRDNLRGYQDQVAAARQRIVDAQRASGLASVNQWNEQATSATLAGRRLVEVRAEIARLTDEQAILSRRLGADARFAGLALRLAADPAVVRLATEHADASAKLALELQRLGPDNPALVIAAKRRESTLDQLAVATATLVAERLELHDLERIAQVLNGSHQADLLKAIVAGEAALEGRRREAHTLEIEIDRLQGEVKAQIEAAAKLEDLRKDQIVAEAVLTSAMARLDTSKSDLYGSYPLVQVLAVPDLPSGPSHPLPELAIAGGAAASLLASLAWVLAWSIPRSGRRRRKSA